MSKSCWNCLRKEAAIYQPFEFGMGVFEGGSICTLSGNTLVDEFGEPTGPMGGCSQWQSRDIPLVVEEEVVLF